jgi:uncharacterized protein (TIGR02594 family)
MATNKSATPAAAWIKSDEIYVDTSKAPWMEVARKELGKNIRELGSPFVDALRASLAADALLKSTENRLQAFERDAPRFRFAGEQPAAARYKLSLKELPNPIPKILGRMEADDRRRRNPEIDKYFDGLKTDPGYDKKGRSFTIDSTYESEGHGEITPWCAAFVNWCLKQVDAPHLGYATAKSWLDFGTPVAHPVVGCITVIKPSSSTGSTTGHVAFFVEAQGDNVKLLGGNQGDRVTESLYKEKNVLGYRWPTTMNHYLAAGTGVLV